MKIFLRSIALISILSICMGMLSIGGFISVTADGIISNGDLELGTNEGWLQLSGESGVTNSVAHNGSYSMYIDSGNPYATLAAIELEVEKNTDYIFGVWYTYETKAAGPARIYFQDGAFGSETSSSILAAANGGEQPILYFSNNESTDGVWTQDTITFNSGNNSKIWLKISGGSKGVTPVYLDDVTFEKKTEDNSYVGTAQKELSEGADVRIMTYNLLVDDVDFSWGTSLNGRPEGAIGCIKYYAPDVIGIQEASKGWYAEFVENLPNYAYVNPDCNGVAYNNCTGIMYNTETLNLIDSDLVRYSVYNNDRMRFVNMGLFERKATGERFIVISSHFDAGDANEKSRTTQAEELAEKIKEYLRIHACPLISVADYNSGVGENGYTQVVENANLTNADPDVGADVIDHILLNTRARARYHTIVWDAAVGRSSDHRPVFADIEFLEGTTYSVETMQRLIKTHGRTRYDEGRLMLDYSASGAEFKLNCSGDVFVTFEADSIADTSQYGGCYFTAVVDGVVSERNALRVTKTGETELCIATGLESGIHTFAIFRQTELREAEIGIKSIRTEGRFTSKPKDRPIYIEFIGDSITCAYGNLGENGKTEGPVDSPIYQDATQGYAYITANNLNADFSLVSYSGIGAKYGYNGFDMPVFYPAQAYPYDKGEYDFERQPDIVVIALGTNDNSNCSNDDDIKQGFDELLEMVRQKNPEAKIVWIYGMMTNDVDDLILQSIDDAGGKLGGYYAVKLTRNNNGAGWHPSLQGQQKFAEELTEYIRSTFMRTPVVRGVTDGEVIDLYTDSAPVVLWDIGEATLNGEPIKKPIRIKEVGEYVLKVTNFTEEVTVSFTIVDTTPTLMKGDPDGDGEITVADALAALRIAARLAEADELSLLWGDIDADGEITVSDALAILRVAANMADGF